MSDKNELLENNKKEKKHPNIDTNNQSDTKKNDEKDQNNTKSKKKKTVKKEEKNISDNEKKEKTSKNLKKFAKKTGKFFRKKRQRKEKEFEEELLQIDRVTRVVKGGRRLRFRATVIIGDKDGRVGFGTDKANEVPQAISKAVSQAKKKLISVPIINGTIPHNVYVKFKAAKVMIMPGKSGSGIIAGGAMRKIANLVGIEDLVGKNFGSGNRITSGKAMMIALSKLIVPTKNKENQEETAKK